MVRLDAQNSSDWRVQMWQAVLPQVPEHLLLGKGYFVSASDLKIKPSSSGYSGGCVQLGGGDCRRLS